MLSKPVVEYVGACDELYEWDKSALDELVAQRVGSGTMTAALSVAYDVGSASERSFPRAFKEGRSGYAVDSSARDPRCGCDNHGFRDTIARPHAERLVVDHSQPEQGTKIMTYFIKTTTSPVGELQLVATEKGLAAVLWEQEDGSRVRLGPFVTASDHPILVEAECQLKLYFDGALKRFTVPLDFKGTPFQQDVWKALLTIPWGETRSYGQIARQIGRPTAFRAVGAANGRNPIAIIAPCHRVVGATGALTGFAGGLAAKELLLGIERGDRAGAARQLDLVEHIDAAA